MADVKNYITPAGFRALQAEFEYLRNNKRRFVVARLADAAAEGDRSENAEYIYRKKQLREIDRRIRFLMKRMQAAEVIDPSHQKGPKVCFGARVVVEDEDGQERTYQIVGVDESDPRAGRISWSSPLGKALIGKEVDDSVTMRIASGERELVLLRVDFPRPPAHWGPTPEELWPPETDYRSEAAQQRIARLGEGAEGREDKDDGEDDEEGVDIDSLEAPRKL